jgi:hypothetical protein
MEGESEDSGVADFTAVTEAAPEVPTPEEIMALPLTTAAAMLPPVEEETPPEPSLSEPPPAGESHGPFVVQKIPGYGDGYRDLILDGEIYEPVGVWLHRKWPSLIPSEVRKLLIEMGLPEARADTYARQRADDTGEIELPPDIEEVWGGGRLDGSGHPAILTARALVQEWGVEGFRGSALHQAALQEIRHVEVKDSFSRAFVEAQKRKAKK